MMPSLPNDKPDGRRLPPAVTRLVMSLTRISWRTGPAVASWCGTAAPEFPAKSWKSGEVDEEAGGRVDLLHQKGQLQHEDETLHRGENESES